MKWVLWGLFGFVVLSGITVTTISVGGFQIDVSAWSALTHILGQVMGFALASILNLVYVFVAVVGVIALFQIEAFRKLLNRAMITAVWLFFGILGGLLYFIPIDPDPLQLTISYWCFGIAGLFFVWRETLGFLDRREKTKGLDEKVEV